MSHSEIKCFLKRQHSGKLCEWGNFIFNSSARSHAAIFEEVVFVSHFYEADIYFVSDSVDCRPLSVRSSISVKGTSCEVSVVYIRKRHLSKNLHCSLYFQWSTGLHVGPLQCSSVLCCSPMEPASPCSSCYNGYRFSQGMIWISHCPSLGQLWHCGGRSCLST